MTNLCSYFYYISLLFFRHIHVPHNDAKVSTRCHCQISRLINFFFSSVNQTRFPLHVLLSSVKHHFPQYNAIISRESVNSVTQESVEFFPILEDSLQISIPIVSQSTVTKCTKADLWISTCQVNNYKSLFSLFQRLCNYNCGHVYFVDAYVYIYLSIQTMS